MQVLAPVSGTSLDVHDVPDPVFASGMVGPGLARAALDLCYPLALAALAVLEAAGCAQLLLAVRHAGAQLR